jgi:hypothetical protein
VAPGPCVTVPSLAGQVRSRTAYRPPHPGVVVQNTPFQGCGVGGGGGGGGGLVSLQQFLLNDLTGFT